MKLTLFLITLSIGFSYHLSAQTVSNNPAKYAEMRVSQLETKLTLNDQQKKDLYRILLKQNVLVDSLKNLSIDNPMKRQQLITLINDENTKIDSLLTDNQRLIYTQWKQSRKLSIKRN